MKKKLTLIATAVALGALVVVGATMAYFTSQDTATNVITTGNVKIELREDSIEKKEDNIVAGKKYTETIQVEGKDTEVKGLRFPENMTPGQKMSKVPTIANTGNNDAYVRAQVVVEYRDAEGNLVTNLSEKMQVDIDYSTDEAVWKKVDGYYYYQRALEGKVSDKEDTTEALFTMVTLPKDWTSNEAGYSVKIYVLAEAIQKDNTAATPEEAFNMQ